MVGFSLVHVLVRNVNECNIFYALTYTINVLRLNACTVTVTVTARDRDRVGHMHTTPECNNTTTFSNHNYSDSNQACMHSNMHVQNAFIS